jgi:hypothetical protein
MAFRAQEDRFGKVQTLGVMSKGTRQLPAACTKRKSRAFIEMISTLFTEQYTKVTMPPAAKHGVGAKHGESSRIWNSFLERHTLFWTDSPSEEERILRFARIGSLVSVILLSLLGAAEVVFFVVLLWYILQ